MVCGLVLVMTAVPGAPGPLRLVLLLLLVLSSSPRRGPPGSPAVASISVRSRIMGTLQVTAWQLSGTCNSKPAWMNHNKDADGPFQTDVFLRIIEDSDTFCCLSPFRSRFSKSRAGTLRCDDHDSLRTIRGVTWRMQSRIVRAGLRIPRHPIIGKNQSDSARGSGEILVDREIHVRKGGAAAPCFGHRRTWSRLAFVRAMRL